ncbi:hypothetical protein BU14_0130s0029 [Porphyra umbilicalis]|uniref:Uncharacterized protein n=1 Tax=Porphyra umbilicalis TaxID=2786 RepID=A0A1X6PAI1_PORUM|nr:hypothetical protein BU14_0130s0029 [Porphyra umbilicalis]|eukprot:OSX77874.1 hypothetical protein BU14_0130s0029 [Porphyra umbilicalis]
MAAAAAAAAVAVAVALAAAAPAGAQSTSAESATRYFTDLRLTQRNATRCGAAPPAAPFNPAVIGQTYSGALECYRPRYPLRFHVRARALVMTAEDESIVNKCAGDVIALRFGKAWERPYFNRKPGVDLTAAFGSPTPPPRFGDSCDAVRAELGVAEERYGPWGASRPDFIRDLCLMTRLVRELRDFRCEGDTRVRSPLDSVVFFLESIAYQYNVPV